MTKHSSNEGLNYAEKSAITLHVDDLTWFCLVQTDDVRLKDELFDIENRLAENCDIDKIVGTLTPERERAEGNEPAPVVGTVHHSNGEILKLEFDVSS